ncbi:MAG: hypothetical protein ABIH09_00360 [Candidatus Omnitrophota bacterium]
MGREKNFNSKALNKQIQDKCKSIGIDLDFVDIKIEDESRVVLNGEISSLKEKELLCQILMDELEVDDIVDNLLIIDETEDESCYDEPDEWLDDDNECAGTEDVFRSVEDGVPYIPPTSQVYYREPSRLIRWKKSKKKAF